MPYQERGVKGINVIGHLRSSTGLGNTARLFIDVLKGKGYDVAGLDVESYSPNEVSEASQYKMFGSAAQLPFNKNLFIVSIDRLPQLWIRHAKDLLAPRFKNAGVLFWELGIIPPAWVPSIAIFDVLLVCSNYIRQTVETFIPDLPTVFAEHPLRIINAPSDADAIRRQFHIPLATKAFCCSFDTRSGVGRKNPFGAIRAWKQAFPHDRRVCLVVKINGNNVENSASDDARKIMEVTAGDPRVILITERLAYAKVLELFSCCDVFVSLHRSEGLGLIPMEAMALGKLVIATGYSGNMTFMTEQNSIPISYRLVEPEKDRPFFSRRFVGQNAAWAEPDIDRAAAEMRAVLDDSANVRQVSKQAKIDIDARQLTAWQGNYFDRMEELLSQSQRQAQRPALVRKIIFNELCDPVLRRKNVNAIFGKRVWFQR